LLLNSSADHSLISKRIIPSLTEYNRLLALDFVSLINTTERRDIAYSQLLREYVEINNENVDFNFIINTLNKVSFKHYKDWILVQVLKSISKNCKDIDKQKKYVLKDFVY